MKGKRLLSYLWVFVSLLFLAEPLIAKGNQETSIGLVPATGGQKSAKYIFFFVGDGLAMPQISATEMYANAISSRDVTVKRLSFSKLPVTGLCTTYDAGSLITDSASAGTAFASGNKTLNGVINMDVSKTKSFKTIAEYAKETGRKVGVVSSVSLDHATPASMYAKVPSRGNYYDIAVQLTQSGFDYFGGGGFIQPKGKNNDKPDVLELAKAKGYTIVNTQEEFHGLKAGSGKVLAISPTLQDSMAMKYEIDRSEKDLSLTDFVHKGIELMQDDPEGFFFFIEGGKIDWACHANDAVTAIKDTLAFDRAVMEALYFAEKHPQETLILVTGDHETGGMAIGFAGTQYETFFEKIALQNRSYIAFNEQVLNPYKKKTPKEQAKLEDLALAIKESFGIDLAALSQLQREQLERAFKRSMGNEVERSIKEEEYLLYGGYEPLTVKLTQIVNQMAGIGWTTYSHTGVPVPIFAKGTAQELFAGYYDNTDIFQKLVSVLGVKVAHVLP
jgi:alkaline phosphatase